MGAFLHVHEDLRHGCLTVDSNVEPRHRLLRIDLLLVITITFAHRGIEVLLNGFEIGQVEADLGRHGLLRVLRTLHQTSRHGGVGGRVGLKIVEDARLRINALVNQAERRVSVGNVEDDYRVDVEAGEGEGVRLLSVARKPVEDPALLLAVRRREPLHHEVDHEVVWDQLLRVEVNLGTEAHLGTLLRGAAQELARADIDRTVPLAELLAVRLLVRGGAAHHDQVGRELAELGLVRAVVGGGDSLNGRLGFDPPLRDLDQKVVLVELEAGLQQADLDVR